MEKEKRFLPQQISEIRAAPVESDGEELYITGKGIVLNERSQYLGFYEYIERSAVENANTDDMVAYFNHDPNYILGSFRANTLEISITDNSVDYRITAPKTQTIRDLVLTPIARGDVRGSSFAFTISDDEWEEKEGVYIRHVKKIDRIYEMGPVSMPAYNQTTTGIEVAKRGLDAFIEATKKTDTHLRSIAEYRLRIMGRNNK